MAALCHPDAIAKAREEADGVCGGMAGRLPCIGDIPKMPRAHEDCPGEREAKDKLRVVSDTLHERVASKQNIDRNSMIGAGGWKHHEDWYLSQE